MMRMAYMNMIYKIRWLLVAQFLLVLVPLTTSKVPAIIAFGDSYSDAGNNNAIPTLLKSNFKPYGRHFPGGHPTGRFCDGRLPPDFISEAFGLKPTIPAYLDPAYTIPDFATGVCFASSGTGYDNATSDVFNVIPLWKELEYYKDYQNKLRAYLGNEKANEILSEALYLLSLGTNDFLLNYYIFPTRRSQFTIKEYEDFLVGLSGNFIRDLYNLGARKISLTGVPPLGCLPLERLTNILQHHDCNEKYNNVAVEFNGKLTNLVRRLNKELRGITIVFADSYHSIYQMITRPSLYGFEEVGVACCSTGTFEISYLCSEHNPLTCSDANKYVFWDAFHPTEKTNRIVVDQYIDSLLVSFR